MGIGGIKRLGRGGSVGELGLEGRVTEESGGGSASRTPGANKGKATVGEKGQGSAPGLPGGGNGSATPHRGPPKALDK